MSFRAINLRKRGAIKSFLKLAEKALKTLAHYTNVKLLFLAFRGVGLPKWRHTNAHRPSCNLLHCSLKACRQLSSDRVTVDCTLGDSKRLMRFQQLCLKVQWRLLRSDQSEFRSAVGFVVHVFALSLCGSWVEVVLRLQLNRSPRELNSCDIIISMWVG